MLSLTIAAALSAAVQAPAAQPAQPAQQTPAQQPTQRRVVIGGPGQRPMVDQGDLTSLSDEFNGTALAPEWRRFDQTFGWPDLVKTIDVGQTVPGSLHLQPYHSAWVRDRIAPFLFKEVWGDFDVRARVRVRSAGSDVPGGTWSLGGLLARTPNGATPENWQPFRENWNFITTGVGHVAGETMTETKSTMNSFSSLRLRPFERGWVELRLVRIGMNMFALARTPGGRWQVRDRFYRMDTRAGLQVGLIAYTTSPDIQEQGPENARELNVARPVQGRVDMLMDVDWVRFSRPRVRSNPDWYAQVSAANTLADPNLSEAALLEALGD